MAWVLIMNSAVPSAKWPMVMHQNGNERAAWPRVQSRWLRRFRAMPAGGRPLDGAASPSGNWPTSAGVRR